MIKIDNLTKVFGEQTIFSEAQIEVKKNEFVAIKGMSGSGKTTLLNIIGLLEPVKQMDYFLNAEIISKNKKEIEKIRRKTFSYVFQDACLISYLNCYDNILMPLINLGLPISKEKVELVAEKLMIKDILYKDITKLSGGEKTRISIARAILTGNPVLLADEPTGNLDPKTSKEVMKLFEQIHLDFHITIIMVTHNDMFDDYFDKIFKIQGDKIYANNKRSISFFKKS